MKKTWYREPWVWFIIFLPAMSVIGGISTYIVFSQNAPSLVSEDYYKDGKKINQDLTKYQKALDKNITFNIDISDDSAVFTKVSGDIADNAALKISFFHVTLAEHDREMMITANANGQYRVTIPENMLTGKWRVRVESFDSQWRVQETIQYPLSETVLLTGDPK